MVGVQIIYNTNNSDLYNECLLSKQNKKGKNTKIKEPIVVLLCCYHQKMVIMVCVCNVQGSLVGSPDRIESESVIKDIHHPINMEMYLGVKDIISNAGYQGTSCKELTAKESNDPNQITNLKAIPARDMEKIINLLLFGVEVLRQTIPRDMRENIVMKHKIHYIKLLKV